MRQVYFFLMMMFFGCVTEAGAQWAYWVVESSVQSPRFSVVKVYDSSHQLIAEKELRRNIDISRRRDRRKLDKIMRISLLERAGHSQRRSRKSLRMI